MNIYVYMLYMYIRMYICIYIYINTPSGCSVRRQCARVCVVWGIWRGLEVQRCKYLFKVEVLSQKYLFRVVVIH